MNLFSKMTAAAIAVSVTWGTAQAGSIRHVPQPAEQSYSAFFTGSPRSLAPSGTGISSAPLQALLHDWDRAGFSAPSKPAQALVNGRGGFATSGPGYNAMVSLIRGAVEDNREGRDRDALAKITKVRHLLAH